MKIVKIAAGVVVALIAVVVVVLLTVDVSSYKGVIQDQAKAATGRNVTIGDIKLGLSLTPAIVVSDVKVQNAPWGSRPDMLILKRLEARASLIPLLFGTVNISGLKVVEADAVLETNAQGKGNWEFDTPAPGPAKAEASMPLNISGISVEGLKLAYRDGKTKAVSAVAAKSAEVEIEGDIAQLQIPAISVADAQASYTQGAMSAQGSVAKFDLVAAGAITDFNFTKLTAENAKGSFKDGPRSYEGAVATLSMTGVARPVSGKTLDPMVALKALNVTALEVANATAVVKDPKLTLETKIDTVKVDAKGAIGQLGITNLALSNTALTYNAGAGATTVNVDTVSLDDKGALTLVAKINGQDVKANGTLAPIATLAKMDKGFPAKLTFDGMGLKGNTDLTVTVANQRTAARGTVNIPELDLSAFIKPSIEKTERLFSDEPLPWEALAANDANVKLVIGKLTLPSGLVLSNVSLPVDLNRGRLVMTPASFGVAGGTVTANLQMNAADKSVGLAADVKGITAETISKEMKKGDLITQGPLDVNLSVRGSGNTPQAIAQSLNGSFVAGMGESRIRSGALNIVGADILMQVLGAVNPVGNKDPYTVARCGVVNLQINNGVGTTKDGIALVTDKMQLTSSGTINFGTERVDLNFRPKATGGLGVGLGALAQAVRVQGPLAAPSIGIDKAGALKTLGTLGAAFASGGLSAIAQGAKDRVDDGGDPCQTARTWHLKK